MNAFFIRSTSYSIKSPGNYATLRGAVIRKACLPACLLWVVPCEGVLPNRPMQAASLEGSDAPPQPNLAVPVGLVPRHEERAAGCGAEN